ncbi:TorD/DmsD family molecular chaperone [Shewanella halifaxensis]|uniref:TorD/DmsD family molecular chaperone n=1 Tax=Shewanella halifaxensis TaxID=271098 RepID=UPI000D5A2242|nr:molecular chaperone TorD family protein [Shewanella halifaxensis]
MVTVSKDRLLELQAIARLLHNTLLSYPTLESVNYFIEHDIAKQWPSMGKASADTAKLLLYSYLSQWGNEQINELKLDYGQLFFGPAEPKAIPWGSVYLCEQQLINDESTVALMQLYKQYGITFTLEYNQPIDHIALFYGVIAELLGLLIDKPENKQTSAVLIIILQQHLLPWSSRCLTLANQHAVTDFYKSIALLALDFESKLIESFNVIPMSKHLFK